MSDEFTSVDVTDSRPVTGFLSGRFRILESYVLGTPVTARLQRPTGSGTWKTIATWSNLGVLIPWFRRHRVVQN